MRPILAALILLAPMILANAARALELPSFLQHGDAVCTNEDDFNGFVNRGSPRLNSATDTCRLIPTPTRVVIISGQGGVKSEVLIMSGANAYEVGWTNGKLPVP